MSDEKTKPDNDNPGKDEGREDRFVTDHPSEIEFTKPKRPAPKQDDETKKEDK